MADKCKALTEAGEPCQAPPLQNQDYCFYHSPDHADEVRAAGVKGGKARHGRKAGTVWEGGEVKIETVQDVLDYLVIALADTLRLENSLQRSRVISDLASKCLMALEKGNFEDRLDQLEKAVNDAKRESENAPLPTGGFSTASQDSREVHTGYLL